MSVWDVVMSLWPSESEKVSGPLELELLMVVSYVSYIVLGTELVSSARAVHTLYHRAVSPAVRVLLSFVFHVSL